MQLELLNGIRWKRGNNPSYFFFFFGDVMLTKKQLENKLKPIVNFKAYNKLNFFLFNLVIKEIVDFELLTLREKRSLIRILENKHPAYYYDEKMQQIKMRVRRNG